MKSKTLAVTEAQRDERVEKLGKWHRAKGLDTVEKWVEMLASPESTMLEEMLLPVLLQTDVFKGAPQVLVKVALFKVGFSALASAVDQGGQSDLLQGVMDWAAENLPGEHENVRRERKAMESGAFQQLMNMLAEAGPVGAMASEDEEEEIPSTLFTKKPTMH